MKLSPRNRYILINPIENEIEEQEPATATGILLPEEYAVKKSPYVTARVIECSPSCALVLSKGDVILAQRRMIEEMQVGDEVFNLLLENYVFGVLKEK